MPKGWNGTILSRGGDGGRATTLQLNPTEAGVPGGVNVTLLALHAGETFDSALLPSRTELSAVSDAAIAQLGGSLTGATRQMLSVRSGRIVLWNPALQNTPSGQGTTTAGYYFVVDSTHELEIFGPAADAAIIQAIGDRLIIG
jgi:hypothetical protein